MSNIQTGAERMPHDLSHLGFLAGQIGRLITISTTPVIAGDSFEMDAVGALRLSPLRRGLAIDSTVDIFTFYVPHRHVYGEKWIKFMKDGVNATPLPTVNTTGYIDYAAFLGTINPDTNKIPKHMFQGYLNVYNNYFKAPWMPDRTEANPNELNQDYARYGFRCCHLKNIWTAPLPPETELSRQMTTSTTSIDIMGLQAAYANLHTDHERDYFMQRYHDVISSFGGKTSYDADNRLLLVMRSILCASGSDVDGTDQTSLGQDRKSGSAGMPRPISYAVFCLKKKIQRREAPAAARAAVWDTFRVVISAGDTSAFAPGLSRQDALGYWLTVQPATYADVSRGSLH